MENLCNFASALITVIMKKILLAIAAAAIVAGCNTNGVKPTDIGGEHACQYVREQVPELREDIECVEVTGTDSLLGDAMLSFGRAEFGRAVLSFSSGEMTRTQYKSFLDSAANVLQDVQNSWQFGDVVNDSLRQLEKYTSVWRTVYKVCVTMKSGQTKNVRVLMDNDGTTPRCLEGAFGDILIEYQRKILSAYDNMHYN